MPGGRLTRDTAWHLHFNFIYVPPLPDAIVLVNPYTAQIIFCLYVYLSPTFIFLRIGLAQLVGLQSLGYNGNIQKSVLV